MQLHDRTEFVQHLAVPENSILPIGWDSSYTKLKETSEAKFQK